MGYVCEPKKSISLALHAKANVQKREGLNHQAQPVKTQFNTERNPQKNPVSSNVLKQNNQKQNSLIDRGKSTPKASSSNVGPQARKPVSQKLSHKKEPYSSRKKKCSIEDTNHNTNNNVIRDRSYRSNSSDVVSFTFTAPIACPVISNNGFPPDNQSKNAPDSTGNDSNSSSLTCNVIGADALSALLEQKLRELTDSPVSVSQDSLLATKTDNGEDSSNGFSSYKPNDDSSYGFSSSDYLELTKKHQKLDLDSSYGFSANDHSELMNKNHKLNLGQDLMNTDDLGYGFSVNDRQEPMFHDYAYQKYLFGNFGRQPSPDSVLKPSFNTESCNSSDTVDTCKQDSASVLARELTAPKFSTTPSPMDVDTDLLDSASSITMVTKWEPEYVTEVLANIETMFVDFTIGKTRNIVNPRVFDRLEFGRPNEEPTKLRRELVFNT
ncbi:uncharacterized protein LOC110919746 [Helianthus annuus]|uniref:uncharacterized protein LOC110919746 n=1 Tax=Helianthus annuus TaxID=4232 RepID=UPI000B907F4C|nr:uncharacterized protein LOC110919746 [Helianthus annuus]